MYFQKVLKGIVGLTRKDADESFRLGILCNWWRRVHEIMPQETVEKLTERNLHPCRFYEPLLHRCDDNLSAP
jgi:hypothetical protein